MDFWRYPLRSVTDEGGQLSKVLMELTLNAGSDGNSSPRFNLTLNDNFFNQKLDR